VRHPEQRRADLEADWNRERTARQLAEETLAQAEKAFAEQQKSYEWRLANAKSAYNEFQSQVLRLESALAQQADDLLAYKDYYGTSPAQVRHLQECYDGCGHQPGPRCPDYPTE